MSGDVGITMIGFRESGKTSYLVGTYGQMLVGRNGFTMRSPSPANDTKLQQMWDKLVREKGQTRWPLETATFDDYEFALNYGGTPLLTIDWVDYEGSSIERLVEHNDMQELLKRLLQSTCVFIAVSGEYLKPNWTIDDAHKKMKIPQINKLMEQVILKGHPTHERPLPVAIVITKYDRYLANGNTKEQLVSYVQNLLSSLFIPKRPNLFSKAPSYLTAICPVTLGKGLANDHENDGEVRPELLHLPIFFAAWSTLRQRLADTKAAGTAISQDDDLEGMVALLAERLTSVPIYLEGEELSKKTQ